jgi:hypothetical protein
MMLLVFGVSALSTIAFSQNHRPVMLDHLVELPPFEAREVIGSWKLVEPMADVTRTIERVQNRYYMVTRLQPPEGRQAGGTHGMELTRISETEYRGTGPNKSTYRINSKNELLMFADGESEPMVRAVPHSSVWPR